MHLQLPLHTLPLSSYHTITLSHYHTITLSHYHPITLSHYTVTLSPITLSHIHYNMVAHILIRHALHPTLTILKATLSHYHTITYLLLHQVLYNSKRWHIVRLQRLTRLHQIVTCEIQCNHNLFYLVLSSQMTERSADRTYIPSL